MALDTKKLMTSGLEKSKFNVPPHCSFSAFSLSQDSKQYVPSNLANPWLSLQKCTGTQSNIIPIPFYDIGPQNT